jgi:hypothetical protein
MDDLELLNQIDNPPPIPNSASRDTRNARRKVVRFAWSEAGEARSPPKTIFTGMNQFISIIIDTRNGRWKENFLSGERLFQPANQPFCTVQSVKKCRIGGIYTSKAAGDCATRVEGPIGEIGIDTF